MNKNNEEESHSNDRPANQQDGIAYDDRMDPITNNILLNDTSPGGILRKRNENKKIENKSKRLLSRNMSSATNKLPQN